MTDDFRRAVDVLRSGGTVAYPTDTVYGLGANGLDPAAVGKVFAVKRRQADAPVPLLVADLAMLRSLAADLPEVGLALAQRYMPGPLTLVVKRAAHVPDEVTGGGPTVGLRIPDHPIPVALAVALGGPIVGTSANLSGMPSAITAAEVRAQLGGDVDCVLEGECWGKKESTVIDVTGATPSILRKGALPEQELAEFLESLFRSAKLRTDLPARGRGGEQR